MWRECVCGCGVTLGCGEGCSSRIDENRKTSSNGFIDDDEARGDKGAEALEVK